MNNINQKMYMLKIYLYLSMIIYNYFDITCLFAMFGIAKQNKNFYSRLKLKT